MFFTIASLIKKFTKHWDQGIVKNFMHAFLIIYDIII
jgi:hypothetical protein